MDTIPLSILICSSNETTMRQLARSFTGEGVQVQTYESLIDHTQFSQQSWDYLVVDLDGIDRFLRNLLPVLFRKFPNLPRIGISTKSANDIKALSLELDAYLSEIPRPEDLIVLFPQVANKYLSDATLLNELMPSSLKIFQDGTNSVQVKAHYSQ